MEPSGFPHPLSPLPRPSRARRAFIVVAAIVAIALADLICILLFGQTPWVWALDYLTSIALLGAAAFGIFVLPLLFTDWLARHVPQSYRTWIWLALAAVFASVVTLTVSLVLRESDILV